MFYVKNLEGSVPQFTAQEPESYVEWFYGADAKFKKVDHILGKITVLKGQGLSSERLICTFMKWRL